MRAFVIVILIVFISCKQSDEAAKEFLKVPIRNEPLFYNTRLIEVPTYSYYDRDLGKLFFFSGDKIVDIFAKKLGLDNIDTIKPTYYITSQDLEILPLLGLDTLSAQPEIRWRQPSGMNLISIGIFKNRIQISQPLSGSFEIENKSDIVWMWTSGMIEGIPTGIVKYSEGKSVIEGKIENSVQPKPLNSGIYVMAIWAWDKDGRKVIMSSKEIPFYVN